MKRLMLMAAAVIGLVATVAAGPARAAAIVGTASIDVGNVTSNNAAGLVSGATLTLSNAAWTSPTLTGNYNVAGLSGVAINFSPITLTTGSTVSFTSTAGNYSGTISSATVLNGVASIILTGGLFTPSGLLAAYDASSGSLNFTFVQSSFNGGVSLSGSATLATVPEPATLGLLGMGLLGLAGVARRRQAKA